MVLNLYMYALRAQSSLCNQKWRHYDTLLAAALLLLLLSQDCVIPLDSSGRSRGFGFVEVSVQQHLKASLLVVFCRLSVDMSSALLTTCPEGNHVWL